MDEVERKNEGGEELCDTCTVIRAEERGKKRISNGPPIRTSSLVRVGEEQQTGRAMSTPKEKGQTTKRSDEGLSLERSGDARVLQSRGILYPRAGLRSLKASEIISSI